MIIALGIILILPLFIFIFSFIISLFSGTFILINQIKNPKKIKKMEVYYSPCIERQIRELDEIKILKVIRLTAHGGGRLIKRFAVG
jgi:hypothetical protein